eukprot:NODE_11623_length_1274_cov_12.476024.p5 GENE.NODE_11623_length_1274_cov_12.476024~~NODE_11623_length_1274_cov_12.476024.p5  ORF type:complete len:73 (+),score=30.11 NODE_11623_length_1274_cov_12.476024:977-1195(+)
MTGFPLSAAAQVAHHQYRTPGPCHECMEIVIVSALSAALKPCGRKKKKKKKKKKKLSQSLIKNKNHQKKKEK